MWATHCKKKNDRSGAAAPTATSGSGDRDRFTDGDVVWRRVSWADRRQQIRRASPLSMAELPRGSVSSLARSSLVTKQWRRRCVARRGGGKDERRREQQYSTAAASFSFPSAFPLSRVPSFLSSLLPPLRLTHPRRSLPLRPPSSPFFLSFSFLLSFCFSVCVCLLCLSV